LIAFLDTEFTDLVVQPRLLSAGIVLSAGTANEFYAEVSDPDRLAGASQFALDAVLPQFGRIDGAACTYVELGRRLGSYFDALTDLLNPAEMLHVAFAYHLDWELTAMAMRDSGASRPESTRRRLRPVEVYDVTGFGAGRRASEAFFAGTASGPLTRHHALCDARALRCAYLAATSADAMAAQSGSTRNGGSLVPRSISA